MAVNIEYIAVYKIIRLNGKNYEIGDTVTGLTTEQEMMLLEKGYIELFDGNPEPTGIYGEDIPYIKAINAQLAEKATKDQVFTMANMGQDIKTAMTGGSVAVVGADAVLETNILNKAVTPKKTSFITDNNLFTKGNYSWVSDGRAGGHNEEVETITIGGNKSLDISAAIVGGQLSGIQIQEFNVSNQQLLVTEINLGNIGSKFVLTTRSATTYMKVYIVYKKSAEAITTGTNVSISDIVIIESGKNRFVFSNNIVIDDLKTAKTDIANLKSTNNSKLIGKKAYFLGDSITQQGHVINGVAEKTGLVITNYGIGGTRLADTDGARTDGMCYRWNTMSATEPDIIFVMGGTNDCYASTVGVVGDTGVTTVAGAVRTIIEGLQTKYPNATIVFSCMPRRFDARWEQYAQIVLDTCAYFGIPCVDPFHESGINEFNSTKYVPDQIHPNADGGKKISTLITDMFNKVVY